MLSADAAFRGDPALHNPEDLLVAADREIVTLRLAQAVPGQLGLLTRRMADAGVNIEVLYSDHNHRLILVVDELATGRAVAAAWEAERAAFPSEGPLPA